MYKQFYNLRMVCRAHCSGLGRTKRQCTNVKPTNPVKNPPCAFIYRNLPTHRVIRLQNMYEQNGFERFRSNKYVKVFFVRIQNELEKKGTLIF